MVFSLGGGELGGKREFVIPALLQPGMESRRQAEFGIGQQIIVFDGFGQTFYRRDRVAGCHGFTAAT